MTPADYRVMIAKYFLVKQGNLLLASKEKEQRGLTQTKAYLLWITY